MVGVKDRILGLWLESENKRGGGIVQKVAGELYKSTGYIVLKASLSIIDTHFYTWRQGHTSAGT